MKQVRTIIVDDEPAARRGLRRHLEQYGTNVVAECSNGMDAIRAIAQHQPDLVFLDIQMPGVNGFGVIENIGVAQMPVTIFVTAFDEHALRAFDANAVDYILKPVDPARLRLAFDRAVKYIRSNNLDELQEKLSAALESFSAAPKKERRIVVKDGGKVTFLPMEEIIWAEAAGNYVNLHTASGKHLIRETMQSLEGRLRGGSFLRVSRSAIVNMSFVLECRLKSKGSYILRLKNEMTVSSSRSYRSAVEEYFV